MKRTVTLAILIVLCAATAFAQNDVRFNKVSITSIRPTSMSSVTATVTINVTSRRESTTVSNIEGTAYSKNGTAFLLGSARDITVPTGTHDVAVTCSGSLADGIGLMDFLRNVSFDPADYTADISCTVRTGSSAPHKVSMKGVSMAQLKSAGGL